jgi:hypothetical protein
MIIHLASDAPLALKAVAAAALYTHIGGASLGLAAGSISMLAKKGGPLHRGAGNGFFAGMLAMGAAGAVTAPFLNDPVSAWMGLFVCYLALTAWATVKRPPGQAGRVERVAGAAAWVLAAGWLTIGTGGALKLIPAVAGFYPIGFIAGAVATIAAGADRRLLRAGGIGGPARTRRHLWRMSLALAIAWGSFAAQPRAQVEPIRGAPWLIAPALITLALLAWWMFRTRDRRRRPALMPKEALS